MHSIIGGYHRKYQELFKRWPCPWLACHVKAGNAWNKNKTVLDKVLNVCDRFAWLKEKKKNSAKEGQNPHG